MARRFSLFRRSEPGESAPTPIEDTGESKGFGFVTYADEPAPSGDPDQPLVVGSVPNTDTAGGNDTAVEELTIAHEGFEPTGGIFTPSHTIQAPRDAASTMAELTPGSSLSDLQAPASTPEPDTDTLEDLDLLE